MDRCSLIRSLQQPATEVHAEKDEHTQDLFALFSDSTSCMWSLLSDSPTSNSM